MPPVALIADPLSVTEVIVPFVAVTVSSFGPSKVAPIVFVALATGVKVNAPVVFVVPVSPVQAEKR